MSNGHCELCGLRGASLSIMNGIPIFLCQGCEEEIGRIGRHSPRIDDEREFEPCEHRWVPTHEGSDHYQCYWCGMMYPPMRS